jgi:AcrR family transcriptional regulator
MPRSAHFENAGRNRERILDAASELMSERGFSGATIAAICDQAEVMPPTLYWHFGDKEGLVAAVMERAAARWFEEFVPAEGLDPGGSLEEAANSLFRERPEFLRLLLLLALERRDPQSEARAAVERVRERAKKSWSRALEARLSEITSPRERRGAADRLSEFLLVQLDGLFVACQIHPDTTDLDALLALTRFTVPAAAEELVRQSRAKRSRSRRRRSSRA